MPYYQKLVGQQCYLSPCSEEDAEHWARWDNDLAASIPLGSEAYTPQALEHARDAVRATMRDQRHTFTVVELASGQAVGRAMLFNIDHINQTAMVGLLIGERSAWGKGYGTEALQLVLDYGFNLLNLHNIMLGVYAYNTRAIALYEKVGFKLIGRRRGVRLLGGVRHDALTMDMLAEEFTSPFVRGVVERIGTRAG